MVHPANAVARVCRDTETPAHREEAHMTYVVNESCIKCKLMDCVEVCPVDCFYEGENMLGHHWTNVSIAGFASQNVPSMRSSR